MDIKRKESIMTTKEQIVDAINEVEHPEIAMSLVNLGMIGDVNVEDEDVSFTLVVPMMGIPEAVRDYMIGSVTEAVEKAGGKVRKVEIKVMNDEERQAFFSKEQSHWKA